MEQENKLGEFICNIKVIGIGGAGNNAVDHMIEAAIKGVEFWVTNTDLQMLYKSKCENKLELGKNLTKGLGAGANPEIGEKAAKESIGEIEEFLKNTDMLFIAAGMGGGTGTGAAPEIAKISKEKGILTVGIITKPFTFEGKDRSNHANEGIQKLREHVDSLIIISNDRLLHMEGNIPFGDAFKKADSILSQSVLTITDLISSTGFINRDFADVKAVLENKGIAMIGFGYGKGENKIKDATLKAISSPLLEASFFGAKNAIVNVTGDLSTSLNNIFDVIEIINEASGNTINVVLGASHDSSLDDEIRVSVIATDFDEEVIKNLDKSILLNQNKIRQSSLKLDEQTEETLDDEDLLPDFLK